MIELARLLGGISALLLVAALATWLNLFRGPILRPIDGRARPGFSGLLDENSAGPGPEEQSAS